MKKQLHKTLLKLKIAIILFFIGKANLSHAQWVTIPDPEFVAFLTANYPSCMSGSMMDTTCIDIINVVSLNINTYVISNLDGIQYFDGLQILEIIHPSLTLIPALPRSLVEFNCYNTLVTSLPPLPNTLEKLVCVTSSLNSLPTLPNSLIHLECRYSFISSLPTLPNSLTYLACDNNLITSLPALPDSLIEINCSNNLITSLPSLTSNIQRLSCDNNLIITLPPLPSSLLLLTCVNNSIVSLPILPNSLLDLRCNNNLLHSIFDLPDSIQILHCSNNHIFRLPHLPSSLVFLACYNNPISCSPILPDGLNYLYMDSTNITCLPSYPLSVLYYDINPYTLPICPELGACPSIANIYCTTYFDTNSDCNYQTIEEFLNVPINIYQSGVYIGHSYSTSGNYSLLTNSGNYRIVLDTTDIPFEMNCIYPGIDTTVNVSDSISDEIYFGLNCRPGYDISVNSLVRTNGWLFPGQNFTVNSTIGDVASIFSDIICNSAGISGVVQFTVSGPATYISPAADALTPSSVVGNIISYSISDFSTINIDTDFGLIFYTDTTAVAGNQICFNIEVTSSGSENNTNNNTLNHCFNVVNSYDPNIKEVSPIGDVEYPFNDWLTYTIHFQNTGTAPAFNIRVEDILDADLDPSTFKLLTTSHPVQVDRVGSNIQFRFNNIMLADSTSNEPASHGYVQFKIKPDASLPVGTSITNTVDIFFDFNPPITTNTTVTNIVTEVGLEPINQFVANIYPNPATSSFIISNSNFINNQKIEMIDMLGKVIYTGIVTQNNQQISLDGISNGVYNVRISDKNGEVVKKLIVSKN